MISAPADAPLIVTALLPKDLAAWATGLRRAHFPPERNYLDAHVTLFHALPPHCCDEIQDHFRRLSAEFAPVGARLERIMSLGGGTAFGIESEAMLRIRAMIAERMHGLLTQQDQHQKRLHVTIQNKVTSAEAKALQRMLEPQFSPRTFAFRGLGLYRYLGGPWDKVSEFAFRGKAEA
uniref:2'-5' RNA ligase family protein n=1 Tax=Parerythrobacter lutipelagi TaxID=1964208 RepID=UPI001EFFF6EC|nr:2'-5' RNA ligase family protein [Parerythrobacter lutipelagi]